MKCKTSETHVLYDVSTRDNTVPNYKVAKQECEVHVNLTTRKNLFIGTSHSDSLKTAATQKLGVYLCQSWIMQRYTALGRYTPTHQDGTPLVPLHEEAHYPSCHCMKAQHSQKRMTLMQSRKVTVTIALKTDT